SEAISVGDNNWKLPGIGSYVALALERRDLAAVGWAILTMLGVILAYDQLLFRPLVAWSARFRFETVAGATAEDPWVLRVMRRTVLLNRFGDTLGAGARAIGGMRLALPLPRLTRGGGEPSRAVDVLWLGLLGAGLVWAAWRILGFLSTEIGWRDVPHVVLLGVFTLLRVLAVMAVASAIWVPLGVWIGLRPAWARRVQPVAQFLAAFPANLFFPVFVLAIVRFRLNTDIFLTPLMLLGTQWYVLFNVVAGAAAFPGDLREAAANFRVGGLLWWRRVALPGIFPYLVTGLITASGNAWNTAIVAEVASGGKVSLAAHGLGAYIADATAKGDMARVMLGIVVMSAFVLLFNRLLWRPLYAIATRRMSLG
ncbi:MAG: ABC transporter permease subunit, partial [Rhodospirillales bacterium]|nr:ABC transporter permease subunit [Rhodospirillales bacterium]